jgi:type IV secretion system protein VirB10
VAGLGGQQYGGYGYGLGGDDVRRAEDLARTTLSHTFSDLANMALRDSINIPPTVHVDQGARIMVFVRRDVDFSSLYPDPVKQALRELRYERALRPASGGPRISK